MIKNYLGITQLEERVKDLEKDLEKIETVRQRQEAIQEELEDIKNRSVTEPLLEKRIGDVLEEISGMVEDMEPGQENRGDEQVQLSSTEKMIVHVLLHENGFLSTKEIAEQIDKSSGTVRKYISMLKDKLDFKIRTEGRKKKYRLGDDVEKQVIQEGRIQGSVEK